MTRGGFFLQMAGVDEAQGFVSQLDHELKDGLRGRLKQGAKLVEEAAASRTHSRRVRAAMSSNVEVRSLSDFEARIGPTRRRAWFAHFLEFGTSHSRDFPFLVPALAATEDQVVELVGFPPSLMSGNRMVPLLEGAAAPVGGF
jgi:HK97 gp10 family phage protein